MAEIKTRIQLKYDTYANWTNADVENKGANLVLKKGEIGFCEIPSGNNTATTAPTVLFKVGDGTTPFSGLNWASALAADVHGWAKASTVEMQGKNLVFKGADGNAVHTIAISYVSTEDIKSYYNKTEVDNLITSEVTRSNAYADQAEADAITAANTYTDDEIQKLVIGSGYATTEYVDGKVEAHATEVTNTLKNYSTTEQMNAAIKVVDDKFANYSTTEQMNTAIKVVTDDLAEYEEAHKDDYTNAQIDAVIDADVKVVADRLTEYENAHAGDYTNAQIDSAIDADVKVVADDLAGYKTTVSETLDTKADKSVVDAMYTNSQIDDFIADAKKYADDNDANTTYTLGYESKVDGEGGHPARIVLTPSEGEAQYIDATPFIKDGMLDNVAYDADTNTLTFTFNTDAGKEAVTVELTDILAPYTGSTGDRIKVEVTDGVISADLVAGSIGKDYLDESVKASLALADSALQSHQSLEHLATKTELQNVDAKFANYTTTTAQQTIDAEQDRRLGVIEGDYLKAADIANFETKENVKKVADDLAAYETFNDAALAEVKAIAEAARTETEVDSQIDTKIQALGLGTMSKEAAADYIKKTEAPGYGDILTKTDAATTYEPIGAEDRAIAAAKTETQNQIAALKIADYAKTVDVEATYRRKDVKITSDDLSDEVFVFNCGSSTEVI